jgi:hypothetical protein
VLLRQSPAHDAAGFLRNAAGVANAVQDKNMPDLVVIKTVTHKAVAGTVQARQDGSGQGPPAGHK